MSVPPKTIQDVTIDINLKDPPESLISSLNFMPTSNDTLLVSSWDQSVRLYNTTLDRCILKYCHAAPVLDACFKDNWVWSGGLDSQVTSYDIDSCSKTCIGSHDSTVKCVLHCPEVNVMVTAGWDSMVKLWDDRTSNCVSNIKQPAKVYTMDVCGSYLIVGTAGRRVIIFDLRDSAKMLALRESNLKYQTRCIRAFPNKAGYVMSSIEGRVAVEFIDSSPEMQKKKYAFKCHRIKSDGVECIYPVNAIAFHNTYNTFATGGSDGFVNMWDGVQKRRLFQFRRYPTHISSLAFNPDGSKLAIASSFIYEGKKESESDHRDEIYVKTVTDNQTKPKNI